MPSLKHIRKRIVSVKNTQKVTKAMKLVAAAKLRRAQRACLASRAYTDHLMQMTRRVAARAGDDVGALIAPRAVHRQDVVVLTSDRGLCGGFNESLIREVIAQMARQERDGIETTVVIVGRKGREALRRRNVKRVIEIAEGLPEIEFAPLAERIATLVTERFLGGQSDACAIAYNRFFSAGTQKMTVERILPLAASVAEAKDQREYLYEPVKRDILMRLSQESLRMGIAQGLLDSRASELAARMRAMDSATKNANEMIGVLTLMYNRARQATITKDLMDIVGGAEALRNL